MKGSDKIIVRRKGGPTKKQIARSPSFEQTRLNNTEFNGRVRASQALLRALLPLRGIFDYSVVNALHKPLKAVQELDNINRKGERRICFSNGPMFLEGIPLSAKYAVESVIRTPMEYSLHLNGTGELRIPELVPGVNFNLFERFAFFRVSLVIALIPDLHYSNGRYLSALSEFPLPICAIETTPWLLAPKPCSARTINAKLTSTPAQGDFIYMMSMGIEAGIPAGSDTIEPVKRHGAGKVLKVVTP